MDDFWKQCTPAHNDAVLEMLWFQSLCTTEALVSNPTDAFREAMSDLASSWADAEATEQTYAAREPEWVQYRPRRGGELPNTALLRDSLFGLANMWLRHPGNLVSPPPKLNGEWDYPNLIGTAIPDLGLWVLGASGQSAQDGQTRWTRTQTIFENKPNLSERDILWFLSSVALYKTGMELELTLDGDAVRFAWQGAKQEYAALRDIVTQVSALRIQAERAEEESADSLRSSNRCTGTRPGMQS